MIMSVMQNMAIKHKLMSIIMMTCAAALVLAGIIQLLIERREYREETIDKVSCYAEMIGDNCKAALAFEDAKDTQETLTSLQAESSIVFSCVYTKEGKVLAHYQRPEVTAEFSPPVCKKEGHKFNNDYFKLFKQIKDNAEVIGTVYIQFDLHEMKAMFWLKTGIIALVVLTCSLVVYLVSSRLQGIISKPILSLTEVAKRVSDKKDYSTRALKQSNDEVGQLIDSFNEMLEQIQQRDLALVEAKSQLERKVRERTAELTTANVQLTKEVSVRKQAEKELAREQRNLEAIFDAAPVGMLLVDENTVVKRTNNVITKLAGRNSSAIIDSQPGDGLGCIHASDDGKGCGHGPVCSSCPTRNTVEDVLRSGQSIHRVEVQPTFLVDGKEVRPWLEISAEPVVIDGSKHVIVAIDDITGRKQAEAELKAAQEKLVDTAHRAGMAEVAADVLHNVGNVLNSINVSTTVIREKVTSSELANLEKVASMINEHTDDLGTFLTEHPQGKHIPVYLTEVSKCLRDEQTDIISKLQVLVDNVQHIRDIVSMQQSYAKVSGIKVQTSLSELAEDAIQINSAGLERHGTRLIREFEGLGDVEIDKQKVLQILVNLVSNAKYALSGSDKEEKILTIRIYKHCEERLRIEVADNGVGISGDNLAKIFSHGFTTKKDGHGFGLHSCALAAKEMGGSLTVHSEGVGQGATFTLELPFKPIKVMK